MSTNSDSVLKEEIDSILTDLRAAYESSGKRVTGQWSKDLEARFESNKAEIWGQVYTAGRGVSKNGNDGGKYLSEVIEDWLKNKGIVPDGDISISSLAFIIARSIHKKGTNEKYHRDFYTEIITPKRIQQVIDRVSKVNANIFIDKVTTEIKLIQTTFSNKK